MKTVYLSAGHGGIYPGAAANGYVEKVINLEMVLMVRDFLSEGYECNIMMARTTDITKRVRYRVAEANENNVDLVVELHFNGFRDPSARGYGTYIHPQIPTGNRTLEIAQSIHESNYAVLRGKTPDRGIRRRDFMILRETKMSAVLIEYLFLTNKEDASLIEGNKVALAKATADGIAKALGLKAKPQNPVYRVIVDGKQIYALREKANIIRQLDRHIGTAKEIKLERV